MFKSVLPFLFSTLFFNSANANILGHNQEDYRHIALGSKFSSYCHINLPNGRRTLIDAEWVLTASHVAEIKDDIDLGYGDGDLYTGASSFAY